MRQSDVLIVGYGLAAKYIACQLANKGYTISILYKKGKHADIWLENNQSHFIEQLKEKLHFSKDIRFENCKHSISAWSTSFYEKGDFSSRTNFNKTELIDSILLENSEVLQYHHIQNCTRIKNHWETHFESMEGHQMEIKSKLIIDASGRTAAWSSKFQTHRIYFDDHLCYSVHFPDLDHKINDSFCIESVQNGWWYMIKENENVQCSLITNHEKCHPDNLSFWEYYLSGTYYIKGYAQDITYNVPDILDVRSSILFQTAGEAWLAVGDAAFTTDPICGQGNEIVINHADVAIDHIQCYFSTNNMNYGKYDKMSHSLFYEHQKQVRAFYQMEKRWPHSSFWK